ncbi:outer membrane protein assembly factor BamD [candidate division KSB1 bacterium]
MNYKITNFLVLNLLLLFTLSINCAEDLRRMRSLPSPEKFEAGKNYFLDEKYDHAKTLLEDISRLDFISTYADSAQLLLAQCHFELGDYILAENEFRRLLSRYPSSSLRAMAAYMIGMCNYELSPRYELDQEYTVKAIEAFGNFLLSPEYQMQTSLIFDAQNKLMELRTKLAEKDLHSGILYKKRGQYEAAIIYIQSVFDNFIDTPVIPKALFEMGECYYKLENYPEAIDKYQALLDNFQDHETAIKAQERLASIKTKTAKIDTLMYH